jgi:hypothetical protein
MKLKEFNTENCCKMGRTTIPSINIDTKVGTVRLNKSASALMGISNADQVKFHQDEDEPGDWYIEKVKNGGFEVREVANGAMVFNNTAICKKIAESVEFSGRSGKCLVAGKPTELKGRTLWGVITRTLNNG